MDERLRLLLVLAAVFGLPALVRPEVQHPVEVVGYGDGTKEPGAPSFDAAPLEALQRVQPRYLFIGNSNTYTRIDEDHLAQLVGGPVLVQATAATGGVHWYLQLKNHLVASGVQPERVFVFYRDGELGTPYTAAPALRQAWSHGQEPAFAALAAASCATWGDHLDAGVMSAVQRIWPMVDVRSDDLFDVAEAVAPEALYGGQSAYAFREGLNARFGPGHLRPSVADALVDKAGIDPEAFETRARCSTLPALLALAQDHQVPLTLVRVQRRTWPDGPAVEAWNQALAAAAADHGVGFLDFSGTPEITASWYGTADHIAPTHETAWTELFATKAGLR